MKISLLSKNPEKYAPMILRYGLAFLFLWFGFSQLLNAGAWVSWVPEWAPRLLRLDVDDIVILNGSFEVIAGSFLAIGIWVRWTALLLALHMLMLVLEIGLTAVGIRDIAIGFATAALAAFGADKLTLDSQVE